MNVPEMSGCASHKYVYVPALKVMFGNVKVPVSPRPVATVVPGIAKLWVVASSVTMNVYVPGGSCVTDSPFGACRRLISPPLVM